MKKIFKPTLITVLLIPLTACTGANMYSETELKEHLAIDCIHEIKPPIPPETEILYDYAKYQDLHKLWTGKAGDWNELAKYYRIAAANGNYKANKRLQYLLFSKRILTENNKKEVITLNEQLEKLLPATAYYGYFFYLKKGYGIKTIQLGELTYLRKAADLGNKEAQSAFSELLKQIKDQNSLKLRRELWMKLDQCASDQGMPAASLSLGLHYKIDKKYSETIRTFHQGVKNGSASSARFLMRPFKSVIPESNKIDYLAIKTADPERAIRYQMIEDYLSKYEYLQPTVPDLDEIVPLPPAKLPRWDGKIAFQRWYEGPSPAKPSDELMQKLAAKVNLDWQTGLPLKK